jgi:hypothetical protein
MFVQRIPSIYESSTVTDSCLGTALNSAFKIVVSFCNIHKAVYLYLNFVNFSRHSGDEFLCLPAQDRQLGKEH